MLRRVTMLVRRVEPDRDLVAARIGVCVDDGAARRPEADVDEVGVQHERLRPPRPQRARERHVPLDARDLRGRVGLWVEVP